MSNIVTNFLDWLFNAAPVPGTVTEDNTVVVDQRSIMPRIRADGTYNPEGNAHFPTPWNMPIGTRADLSVAPDYSRVRVPQNGGFSLADILATFLNANGLTMPGVGTPPPSTLPPIIPPGKGELGGKPATPWTTEPTPTTEPTSPPVAPPPVNPVVYPTPTDYGGNNGGGPVVPDVPVRGYTP